MLESASRCERKAQATDSLDDVATPPPLSARTQQNLFLLLFHENPSAFDCSWEHI